MASKKGKSGITLDRQAYHAMEFLKLQAECKDWIESVLGADLANKDLYTELKSGQVLCKMMNTLFPGSIRNVHKASFAAHQVENIGFVLRCLRKMGMKEDQLFEPLDLHEKKNMMKVFRCIASFAEIVSGSGKARRWRRKDDISFSDAEIAQWKADYGDLEMEFSGLDGAGGGGGGGGDDDGADATAAEHVEDVEVFDSSMFPAPSNVSLKTLGHTLDDLIRAVDEVERFDDDGKARQTTADDTEKAAVIAAQYAAQVAALGAAAAAEHPGDRGHEQFRRRLDGLRDDIDAANEAMVAAQNAWQKASADGDGADDAAARRAGRELTDKCEELKRVARDAYDAARRRPASCASPSAFDVGDGDAITDADIDVSLAELVKAVRKAQDIESCAPHDTTGRTEDGSRKAARFAAQLNAIADAYARRGGAYKPYADKMGGHGARVQEANEDFVAASNRYVGEPAAAKGRREFDEACEELIRVATNAARDAKRRPPPAVRRARAADFDVDGVSDADLTKALRDVVKAANKTAKFADDTPVRTAEHATDASKKAAKLEAQVRWVGGRVKKSGAHDELARRIRRAADDLDAANGDMVDAANAYGADDASKSKQRALADALEELKRVAAASCGPAKDGLDALAHDHEDDENLKDIDPVTAPLQFATLKGDLTKVRDLIEKGMKVDSVTAQGWTPLYTAAYVGNLDLIRFFVRQGADVNVRNKQGWTPLFAAVSQGHKHVVKPLLNEYDAEINVQSEQGTTPIYHSAEQGRYTITRMLLDAGADVELCRAGGWKPVHGAVFNYHYKVTRMLVEAGASIDVANDELKRYTPLHIAISTKSPNMDLVRLLADKAEPDAKNKNGATPLHLAAMWGHTDVVKLLVRKGASTSATNKKHRTPLEVAVRNGHSALARWLADHDGREVPELRKNATRIGVIESPAEPPPPPTDGDE